MKKPFIFRGKETSYDYSNDGFVFTFDFGDGDKDFIDDDGDKYFFHCQYCMDPNCDPFSFEIWWEYDLTSAGFDELSVQEREEIKKFMMELINNNKGDMNMEHIIKTGYKLFEMNSNGQLFPLFIGKTKETPMNEWIMAEIIDYHPSFAHRPGWHLGAMLPSAPWLLGADGTYKSQRGKKFRRVWCKVEYVADIDYTEEVSKLPKKCFTDRLPDNGFYNFRESGDRLWVIADRIRVTHILSEEERQQILKEANYDEQETAKPYMEAMRKRMKVI